MVYYICQRVKNVLEYKNIFKEIIRNLFRVGSLRKK